MAYEVVIGLEVHAQLLTASKMFCGCGTAFGAAPNTQTCPVCLGMPGVLPVINRKAVEFAVRTGLALHCTIAPMNRFARKHYFYPDLPKNYQVSQYELPICEHGWLEIGQNGTSKRVRIRRAHLEEDAGKNLHAGIAGASHVDLNRAGTPLLEIVTEPDMGSPDEAVAYLKTLRDILVSQKVCDGNMEEGSFRCEPNLSLRPAGSKELGTKVELKNINSFKFVKAAMEYEIKRQTKVLDEGGKVVQETRLWDTEKGETAVMRSKEEAHDYRYFPDPDLVPLRITEEMIAEARKSLQELPEAKHKRFVSEFGLTEQTAAVLTANPVVADYFVASVTAVCTSGASKTDVSRDIANWITVDLPGLAKDFWTHIPAGEIGELSALKRKGEISGPIVKAVLEERLKTGKSVAEIIKAKGLVQVSDEGALEKIIDEVMAKNPQQVAQYKSGKEAVFGFFVGQVMKASGGKANPAKVNELLKRKLTQ
ncbi:MAG: Asp-tRNA(Asn)/Glu-tRNA(Gln) amidotransferase subunit GatB [Nitrospirae bacterium]|nr:MAG: Asp-tRNA(Asn)/Glu-tRNA(Gln) amidotransferase subunit GatB [Nitrospirota bacterium]